MQHAFKAVTEALSNVAILAHMRQKAELYFMVDASGEHMGIGTSWRAPGSL